MNTDVEACFERQDVEAMTQVACELVDIPSPTGEEGPIGEYVARVFGELGLRWRWDSELRWPKFLWILTPL